MLLLTAISNRCWDFRFWVKRPAPWRTTAVMDLADGHGSRREMPRVWLEALMDARTHELTRSSSDQDLGK